MGDLKKIHFHCRYMLWCWSCWKYKGQVHTATQMLYQHVSLENYLLFCNLCKLLTNSTMV